ncbi:MAG: hypothetical protein AAGA48_03640 [Myxococcota bacterium]
MFSFRLQWGDILRHGLVLSAGFTAVVLLSYWIEPLVWANDFPPEVQDALGPIPPSARWFGVVVFVSILSMLFGVPYRLGRKLRKQGGEASSFASVFIHALLVLMLLNVWDLLVVDIFIFGVLKPDFMMIVEAKEWLVENVTTAFHVQAFFIGVPILVAIALAASACAATAPGQTAALLR